MKLRSGKVIIKKDEGQIQSKTLIEFNHEIIKRHINKKINNKEKKCVRQIILESLKKCINIKLDNFSDTIY
jgi:hypothetical protein